MCYNLVGNNLDEKQLCDIEKRLYELEKKQDLLITGILRVIEKLGFKSSDNLELFCLSTFFSYDEFERFKLFLVENSIKLHNKKLSKNQFINEFIDKFPEKKSLLSELMEIINKSDDFEGLCNLYFNKNKD